MDWIHTKNTVILAALVASVVSLGMLGLVKAIKMMPREDASGIVVAILIAPMSLALKALSTTFSNMECTPQQEKSGVYSCYGLGIGLSIMILPVIPLICAMIAGCLTSKYDSAIYGVLCCLAVVGVIGFGVWFSVMAQDVAGSIQGLFSGVGGDSPWGCDIDGVQPFMLMSFFVGILSTMVSVASGIVGCLHKA